MNFRRGILENNASYVLFWPTILIHYLFLCFKCLGKIKLHKSNTHIFKPPKQTDKHEALNLKNQSMTICCLVTAVHVSSVITDQWWDEDWIGEGRPKSEKSLLVCHTSTVNITRRKFESHQAETVEIYVLFLLSCYSDSERRENMAPKMLNSYISRYCSI